LGELRKVAAAVGLATEGIETQANLRQQRRFENC